MNHQNNNTINYNRNTNGTLNARIKYVMIWAYGSLNSNQNRPKYWNPHRSLSPFRDADEEAPNLRNSDLNLFHLHNRSALNSSLIQTCTRCKIQQVQHTEKKSDPVYRKKN